jgi:hypothetical protein
MADYTVEGRWYWTAARDRLVAEGDPEAAFLAYPAGTVIPEREARQVGLKQRAPAANKLGRRPLDKSTTKGESA